MEEEIEASAEVWLECVLCGRQSERGLDKWKRIMIYEQVFVCKRCPEGMRGHYEVEHEEENALEKRGAARSARFMIDGLEVNICSK